MWLKIEVHPCWRVQKALDESGIEYDLAIGPLPRRKRRDLAKLTGQWLYPAIEFDDGGVYRDQSKRMAERIRSGQLFEKRGA
jgi:hypothetical protein